jgi:hypothetical protein
MSTSEVSTGMCLVGQIGSLEDVSPEREGWYATLECWDVEEGMFPGAHYWNGTEFDCAINASISYWPVRFDTKEEAESYAYANDSENV